MPTIRALGAAFAFVSTCATASAGNVLVVDATNPPGTLPTIQAALDASVDGDTILVRSGTYARFDCPDRELAIVADAGATVDVTGAPRLLGLSASRTLYLAGLRVTGVTAGALRADALVLQNAAGSVRIEDCVFEPERGVNAIDFCSPRAGAIVNACNDVAFTRCTIRGQSNSPANHNFAKGGTGVSANGSNVAFHESSVQGGHGGNCNFCDPFTATDLNCVYGYTFPGDGADGGAAVRCVGGQLFFSRCAVLGGDGGLPYDAMSSFVYFGGCGGTGISASGTVVLWGLATAPAGGVGQLTIPPGQGSNGLPGAGVLPGPSSFLSLPGSARDLRAPNVVREGQPLHVRIDGLPGDRVAVLLALDPARAPSLPFRGWYLLPPLPASRFVRLGLLDASGALDRDLIAPTLAPGEFARTLYLQSLHTETQSGSTLGPPQTVVVIDSSL